MLASSGAGLPGRRCWATARTGRGATRCLFLHLERLVHLRSQLLTVLLHCPQCPGIVPCIPANVLFASPETCRTTFRSPVLDLTFQSDVHSTYLKRLVLVMSRRIPRFTIHFSQHLPVPALFLLGASRWIDTCELLLKSPRGAHLTLGSFPATSLSSICRPTWPCLQLSWGP